MKKLAVSLFFLFSMYSFAFDGHLRLGTITNTNSYDKEQGFEHYAPTIGFELTQSFIVADLGVGVAYNGKNAGAEIVPGYLVARWNVIPILIKPYVVAKVGKVVSTNPKGDYYYGAGIGMNFAMLQGELLYSITKIDDSRKDDQLKQLSLVLGYKLF